MTAVKTLRQGACARLELAAKRGAASLEKAWQRFTPRQRALVPSSFIVQLRREAAVLEGNCKTT